MKRFSLIFALLFTFTFVHAQAQYPNHPLPDKPDTLRILAIGNSFSDDATQYLPGLLEAAGIRNVILGRLYIGGCTLERHCREYEQNARDYEYRKSVHNKWVTVKKSKEGSFMDGLGDEPWDIITLQQASPKSGQWDSYDPWLGKLIVIVRENCRNPNAAIVWHQTWAYSRSFKRKNFANYAYDQDLMHTSIQACVDRLSKDYDIPVVIPSGPAVKAMRASKYNTDNDLTRDGFHMDYIYGRYLTACVWFEALIRPVLGVSVVGNSFRNEGTSHQISRKEAAFMQKTAARTVKNNVSEKRI